MHQLAQIDLTAEREVQELYGFLPDPKTSIHLNARHMLGDTSPDIYFSHFTNKICPLLSVGDERSRGASRLLSRLSDVGLLLGCIALRTLLRHVIGLLILARCLLTLEVQGDLGRCSEHWSWWRSTGVAAMAINAWLIGFSLRSNGHGWWRLVWGTDIQDEEETGEIKNK